MPLKRALISILEFMIDVKVNLEKTSI